MKKRNRFGIGFLVLFIGLVIGAVGCQKQESSAEPAKAPEAKASAPAAAPAAAKPAGGRIYRFAFIHKALHIPVFNYAKIGAERQAKRYGNVEIIWNAPFENDQVKQKEILETFIAQGVDGIAISCLNGDYLTPTINEAVAKGIPVVTWDSDAPKSKRVAFFGVNDFETGVIMGKEIVKLLGDQGGKIAVITTLGADNLAKRLEGAMSVIRQSPQIKVVETFDVEDSAITSKRVIDTATETYPDLRAWLSVGGWPGFSRNILDAVDPKKTFVVTFDVIPPAPEIIKDGRIQLALGQKYFGWGSEPTKILYNIVVNHKYPENPIVDSGVDIVTPENVDAYIQKWDKMSKGETTQ
jgi:ribose transport system substrate-binding protein